MTAPLDTEYSFGKMWKRLLGGGLLLRAIVRELTGIRLQLTRQTDLLERWAIASGLTPPAAIAAVQPGDLTDTGVSFLDPIERGLVEDYIARTTKDTGREPTEDEILFYLADEKTIDLHTRLRQREASADLDRLQKGSR